MSEPVHLFETTLRDGSYEILSQFTAEDTAYIAGMLDAAGVKYIEVCHSHGIGSEQYHQPPFRPKVRATADDQAHMEAAQAVVKNAIWGVLLGTGRGFTPAQEIRKLSKYGMGFVRLALWPDDGFTLCPEYIDEAKSQGLIVSLNLMQTYTLSVSEVAAGAADAAKRGADWFYIVDSAGGMTTSEVREYVRAVRDASGMTVGLHAHNNIGLAVANSLAAIEAGATLVDSSLQGIGRATGNPPTEQLLLLLQRLGHELQVDRDTILSMGEMSRSLFAERGNDPTHFVSGTARLHSRHVANLVRVAKQRGRSPRELLRLVGAEVNARNLISKNALPEALVDALCEQTPPSSIGAVPQGVVERVALGIERDSRVDLSTAVESLFVRSEKRHKPSVLHLVAAATFPFAAPLPWETGDYVGLTLPVTALSAEAAKQDRLINVLLIDPRLNLAVEPKAELRLAYPFDALCADATADLAAACAADGQLVWLGDLDEETRASVQWRLRERGVTSQSGTPCPASPKVIVAVSGAGWTGTVGPRDTVVLCGRTPVSRSVVDQARATGAVVLRPALGPAIGAKVLALACCATRLGQPLQPRAFAEVTAVDSWIAPGSSDAVVDSLIAPTQVLDPGSRTVREVALAAAAVRTRRLAGGEGPL